jgi:hypothetical protein
MLVGGQLARTADRRQVIVRSQLRRREERVEMDVVHADCPRLDPLTMIFRQIM